MPTKKQSAGKNHAGSSVDDFVNSLEHPYKVGLQALRKAILSADKRIQEEVKWNAPSYRLNDHFATFRLHPVPAFQLVLHTGAKSNALPKQFALDDPDRLVKWVAKDRCTITFTSDADALAKRDALTKVVKAWIAQL